MIISLNTFGAARQGRMHAYENIPCQDAFIVCQPVPNVTLFGGADGCSSAAYCIEAAKINLEVAKTVAGQRSYWNMTPKAFIKNLARLLVERLQETGLDLDELAATLAFVMIDHTSGECIAFSIGDTAILSFDDSLHISEHLKPVNGISSNYTVFTNSIKLIQRYGYYKKTKITPKTAGFIVYTDGAQSLVADPSHTEARQMLAGLILGKQDAAEQTISHIAEIESDDITVCGGFIPSERLTAAAKAAYSGMVPAVPAPAADPATVAVTEKIVPEDALPEVPEEPATPKTQHYIPAEPKPHPVPPETERKTTRYAPAAPQKENAGGLIGFLSSPRPAEEIIAGGFGFDRDSFMLEMIVLMRTGLVIAEEGENGKTLFHAA